MSDLKSGYERELLHLRRGLSEFGAQNGRAAGRLSMQGKQSENMHVERLIQAAALINARVRERLEDNVLMLQHVEIAASKFWRTGPVMHSVGHCVPRRSQWIRTVRQVQNEGDLHGNWYGIARCGYPVGVLLSRGSIALQRAPVN